MILKTISAGERAPAFWGRAYYRWETDETVIVLVPLNWLVGWGYQGFLRVRRGARDRMKEDLNRSFNRGFQQGWDGAIKLASQYGYDPDIGVLPRAAPASPFLNLDVIS